MNDGYSYNLKRTLLVRIVDCICAILLIGCTLWVACQYGSLPDRIPIHYGANGVINGYGSKGMIWLLITIIAGGVVVVGAVVTVIIVAVKKSKKNETPNA